MREAGMVELAGGMGYRQAFAAFSWPGRENSMVDTSDGRGSSRRRAQGRGRQGCPVRDSLETLGVDAVSAALSAEASEGLRPNNSAVRPTGPTWPAKNDDGHSGGASSNAPPRTAD